MRARVNPSFSEDTLGYTSVSRTQTVNLREWYFHYPKLKEICHAELAWASNGSLSPQLMGDMLKVLQFAI